MIEYKNLWSNWENIRENPEKYKEWKIDEIITEIMKFLITHDYNITYENGEIEKHYLNENIELIEYGFLPIFKKMDFSKIQCFCFGIYQHDDYYCILFFDGDLNIIDKIFWDFDFTIYHGEKTDYDFMDDFNPFEWL